MTRSRAEYALALLLDLLGAAVALLVSTRVWQTVVTPRPRPLADDVLALTGRTVDAAPTALAVMALAGVVAVLATRGVMRRAIGGALLVAGAALVWRSIAATSAVSPARARDLVRQRHSGVGLDATTVAHVTVHGLWPVLSVACGVLVALAGLLVVVRGHRWAGLSARYEAPAGRPGGPVGDAGRVDETDEPTRRARANTALWNALDRGDDPTDKPTDGPTAGVGGEQP